MYAGILAVDLLFFFGVRLVSYVTVKYASCEGMPPKLHTASRSDSGGQTPWGKYNSGVRTLLIEYVGVSADPIFCVMGLKTSP